MTTSATKLTIMVLGDRIQFERACSRKASPDLKETAAQKRYRTCKGWVSFSSQGYVSWVILEAAGDEE